MFDRTAFDNRSSLDSRSRLNVGNSTVCSSFGFGLVGVLSFGISLIVSGIGMRSVGLGSGHDRNEACHNPRLQLI